MLNIDISKSLDVKQLLQITKEKIEKKLKKNLQKKCFLKGATQKSCTLLF